MQINWPLVVEFIKIVVWPLVSALALYILRRPLIELLGEVARRAIKLSVYQVSVELTPLPELETSWSIGDQDIRQLTSSSIESYPPSLFMELLNPARADYAIVDLGTGHNWITSRLYIFALILGEAKGLQAFVFLENARGIRRRFLMTATSQDVRKALARQYPWFEEAFAKAYSGQYPETQYQDWQSFLAGDQTRVIGIVQSFLSKIQTTNEPPPDKKASFLEFRTEANTTWERARWIDGEVLERVLPGLLEDAWYTYSPDGSRGLAVDAILRRAGRFIALVNEDRQFKGLVDRYALLDEVWRSRDATSPKAE